MRDTRRKDPESWILIHQNHAHPDTPLHTLLNFRVMSSYRSSFARQLAEAVETMTFKGGELLNRKEMFNRCIIPKIFMKGPTSVASKDRIINKNKKEQENRNRKSIQKKTKK